MADHERDRRPRRGGGGGGGQFNNRKRRFNRDDDWEDRRPQRRRHEEPVRVSLRKRVLGLAEGGIFEGPPPTRRPDERAEDQVATLAKMVADNYFDSDLTGEFTALVLQMIIEQPLKIPFLAAVILITNTQKPEYTQEFLKKIPDELQGHINAGRWREVKLYLRFLGSLQGMWDGEGVFPILEEMFTKAVELQTSSSDDTLGLELVKIILLTIPYTLASSAMGFTEQANSLIERTDIIASTPHTLETLVDPFPSMEQGTPTSHESALVLLQRHMQEESKNNWEVSFLPRPWKLYRRDDEEDVLTSAQKHAFPAITFPDTLQVGPRSIFPEIYFSVYSDQGVDTVPPPSDSSAIVIRDALNDNINSLDCSRGIAAQFLIDVDRYFGRNTFVARETPFDKLREVAGDKSMWKPEDVAVDACFAQIFLLPAPEHKLVYYHSVLTEACKLEPRAVAPSLGRAIRFLYRNVERFDLELNSRMLDWFAHHLSNFGFTWKWTEWTEDLELPNVHPRKAFILDALEKEIRLSFAQRVRGTLPDDYKPLITAKKEQDTPDFKFADESVPFATQGKEISQLIRKKATDEELAPVLENVEAEALAQSLDPKATSTDVFVTALCHVGSKSISHLLVCVERYKERLLVLTSEGKAAQKQIISSAMGLWAEQKGTGVNVIDKLLNYHVVTSESVIEWVLIDNVSRGMVLAQAWAQELVGTVFVKQFGKVKQIVAAVRTYGLAEEKKLELQGVLESELAKMKNMYALVQDAVGSVRDGTQDMIIESSDQLRAEDEQPIKVWGAKWAKAWSRRGAVAEAWVREELAKPLPPPPPGPDATMTDVQLGGEDGAKRAKTNGAEMAPTNGVKMEDDMGNVE